VLTGASLIYGDMPLSIDDLPNPCKTKEHRREGMKRGLEIEFKRVYGTEVP
jgi:hypothetical protein